MDRTAMGYILGADAYGNLTVGLTAVTVGANYLTFIKLASIRASAASANRLATKGRRLAGQRCESLLTRMKASQKYHEQFVENSRDLFAGLFVVRKSKLENRVFTIRNGRGAGGCHSDGSRRCRSFQRPRLSRRCGRPAKPPYAARRHRRHLRRNTGYSSGRSLFSGALQWRRHLVVGAR